MQARTAYKVGPVPVDIRSKTTILQLQVGKPKFRKTGQHITGGGNK